MKSPIFWVHTLTKVLTHYALILSLTLANDVMKASNTVDYDKLQTQYELIRGVTRLV